MIWLFIILSLTLHIIGALCFILLYQRLSVSQQETETLSGQLEAAFNTMEMYVEEIGKGNEALYEKIANTYDTKQQVKSSEEQNERKVGRQHLENHELAVTAESVNIDVKEMTKKEKYKYIEQLLKEGFSESAIAERLKCGTGEIQLIRNMVKNLKEG